MTSVASDSAQMVQGIGPADTSRSLVLLVTDSGDSAERHSRLFTGESLDVTHADSLAEALYQLRARPDVDLVVADASTGRLDVLELTRKIKRNDTTRLLPVIVLLGTDRAADRLEMLHQGADDCLAAPFHADELVERCNQLIRQKRATDALEDSENVIFTLARIIEGRDKYTQGHVERVAAYSVEIGKRLHLHDHELAALHKGGVVHDLGKIAVPDAILNKPGKLDDSEWKVMKTHPVVGYDVLVRLRTFHDVLDIVRSHHERPNGQGYPDGIGGDALPLLPRIAAVADCFDAVTTPRPYHEPKTTDAALDIILEGARRGDFDRDVATVFSGMVRESPAA